MAKAKKLPSGNWRCEAYIGVDAAGKRIRKSFTAPTKKEAEFLATQYLIAEHKDGDSQTFLAAYHKMLEIKKPTLSPSSFAEYQKNIKNDYYNTIKDIPIRNIDDAMVQKMINNWIKKGLSPKTVRDKYFLFKSVVQTIDKSADYNIVMPDKFPTDIHIPTDEDVRKLVEVSKGTPVELPIMLAAYMGMRRSEIIALKWGNVDMERRILHIVEATVLDENRVAVTKQPKSVAGKRSLPIPDIVFEALERHQGEHPVLVAPLTGNGLYRRFKTVQKKAGLNDFRFHDLRHYNASVMLALGIPDKYAMERMGHSTNSTLKNVYQHTMKNKQDEFTALMDNYFKSPHETPHKK